MRSFAAFIMRGRLTAALVATIAGVLFWLFPPFLIVAGAVIALVTLRRGPAEGAVVIVLGGFGAVVLSGLGLGVSAPTLAVCLLYWLPLWLLALILRQTISLSRTLQVAAFLGMASVAGTYLVIGDPSAWWSSVLEQWQQLVLANIRPEQNAERASLEQMLALLKSWAPYLVGQVVSVALALVISALLLGRWWQAVLFNPAGFGPEFQALRLGRPLAVLVIGLFGLAIISKWTPLANIALVMGTLYIVQGIALSHALVFKLHLSSAWLVLFYLLLVPLLSQVVMALGLIDAWADFRNRIQPRPN
jgi:hypothetical protein